MFTFNHSELYFQWPTIENISTFKDIRLYGFHNFTKTLRYFSVLYSIPSVVYKIKFFYAFLTKSKEEFLFQPHLHETVLRVSQKLGQSITNNFIY